MSGVVSCGHCNTVKAAGEQGWKFELGFDFCPGCKDNYWHTAEVLPQAPEASWECPNCGAHVLYTGEHDAPLVHC